MFGDQRSLCQTATLSYSESSVSTSPEIRQSQAHCSGHNASRTTCNTSCCADLWPKPDTTAVCFNQRLIKGLPRNFRFTNGQWIHLAQGRVPGCSVKPRSTQMAPAIAMLSEGDPEDQPAGVSLSQKITKTGMIIAGLLFFPNAHQIFSGHPSVLTTPRSLVLSEMQCDSCFSPTRIRPVLRLSTTVFTLIRWPQGNGHLNVTSN